MVSTLKCVSKRPFHNCAVLFFFICFFIIASIPRLWSLDAHWSSDEGRWLNRSATFISAIQNREFSETLIAHHPGVTTMWISGLRTFFLDSQENLENLVFARLLIGIIVWVGIGIACLLLYRLFGKWVALGSFTCLVSSPLFLAQTRRVHTDALAATFILLTVLLFLLYCQNRHRHRYLTLSGITFGLALLSKSYALILLPWIPICLFLFRDHTFSPWGKPSLIAALCFLNVSLLTMMIVWPVFWTPTFIILAVCLLGSLYSLATAVKKETISLKSLPFLAASVVLGVVCIRLLQTIWTVFDTAGQAIITPHEVEHYFLGKIVNDPGWLFYPFVLTIKSTPLMLPLALVGCLRLWKHRKDSEAGARHFKSGSALAIGALLFTVCLSITSKKFSRYLLPVFLLLEILAAIGVVEGLNWCYAALRSRFGEEAAFLKHTFTVVTCLSLFLIQVMPVLILHPYYGTYYNLCWKVTDLTKIITVGEASGLDIASKYLRKKQMDRPLRVQVSPLSIEFFARYFIGLVKPADRVGGPPPDYEVVYIRDSQIGRVPQTGTLNGELEAVITLNGIDHVWIYQIPPPEDIPD